MRRIEEKWTLYKSSVLPKDAPSIQIRETRLAFYAGASALYEIILNALEPGEDATDGDLKMMDDLKREIDDFVQNVVSGTSRRN